MRHIIDVSGLGAEQKIAQDNKINLAIFSLSGYDRKEKTAVMGGKKNTRQVEKLYFSDRAHFEDVRLLQGSSHRWAMK